MLNPPLKNRLPFSLGTNMLPLSLPGNLINAQCRPPTRHCIFMLFKEVDDGKLEFWNNFVQRASLDLHFCAKTAGMRIERVNDTPLFHV